MRLYKAQRNDDQMGATNAHSGAKRPPGDRNVPSKSLLSVRGMKGRVSSGGYSNLGARGKGFQKLMFSKKKEF